MIPSRIWRHNKIKGVISEAIVEEMLRDLGFYVLKMGQEHTINPIIHLRKFIKECGGDFKLEKCSVEEFGEIDYITNLPDFLIIDKKGRVDFLEVKYRKSGKLKGKELDSLKLYKKSKLLLVSPFTEDGKFYIVYSSDNEEKLVIVKFQDWLEKEFEIIEKEVIDEYEALVDKWYVGEKDNLE